MIICNVLLVHAVYMISKQMICNFIIHNLWSNLKLIVANSYSVIFDKYCYIVAFYMIFVILVTFFWLK